MQPIQRIGYIGLGIMGAPMAHRLLQAGYTLYVWNRTARKTQPLVDAGAHACRSPADVAAQSPDCICINVTDTQDVEEVLFGNAGIIHQATPALIIIDHSTISASATQQFAKQLAEKQITLLDAPVSGGDIGAQQGTLSVMVGGEENAFERCLPMLETVGKSIIHLGPSGMGQACKACNQVAVAGNLMGTIEAMAMARSLGLDQQKMIRVVSQGAGGSWQLENLGPRIAQGDFDPGFMIRLILKDLDIVLDHAKQHGLSLHATELARKRFEQAAENLSDTLGTQAIANVVGFEPATKAKDHEDSA